MFLVFLGKRGEITYQNLSLDIDSITPEKGRMKSRRTWIMAGGDVSLGAVELRPDGRE
jgi:hypothetical protein